MANSSSTTLAPGFRFHPTDEELIIYYLKRKLLKRPILIDAISSVNLYQLEPWDLPPLAKLQTKDQEWFFFCPLDRKNNCHQPRTNRATPRGYWKTTGKDREVFRRDDMKSVVGMKKTLVYHSGRAPRGKRTKWVMHEYRLLDDKLVNDGFSLDGLVVCRIFEKKAAGHQIGAQYGAPVIEEESDEETGQLEKDKEEEQVQNQLQKGKIENQNCSQLVNPHENINPNMNIKPSNNQNDANISQINQEPDIFNGLDEISNQDNLFFEMNDLSKDLNANLPNCPPLLNSTDLNANLPNCPPLLNSTDLSANLPNCPPLLNSTDLSGNLPNCPPFLNPAKDDFLSFFDSLEEFDQTGQFNQTGQFDQTGQIFSNENFGDEFGTFFDAVGSNSFGNSSGSDDILQNYEGVNGNYSHNNISHYTGINSTENIEISNNQDIIPNQVPYSPLSERLISLLDSYSPPPAFASELKPSNFLPKSPSASSASIKKSKSTKVNSVVSRVLRGVLCAAIVLMAGCKLAICIRAR